MSARDDYPALDYHTRGPAYQGRTQIEGQAALDEIDHLRDDVSKLLAKLATTDASWP